MVVGLIARLIYAATRKKVTTVDTADRFEAAGFKFRDSALPQEANCPRRWHDRGDGVGKRGCHFRAAK